MKNTQTNNNIIRYAVSAAEMKRCDEATITEFGISQMVLMERAALSLCAFISKKASRRDKIYVFAGKGNNGGDGIALARLLYQNGFDVTAILTGHRLIDGEARSSACNKQLLSAQKYGVTIIDFEDVKKDDLRDADIIVDAILGIGCKRDLEGEYERACKVINDIREEKKAFVLAADIPTGINADDGSICKICVKADKTITFGFMKMGLILYPGCEYAGNTDVEPVGITRDGFGDELPKFKYICPENGDIAKALPKRKGSGNKGTFGKVLVIAGNRNSSGALIMAMESCLRSGAGMVRAFTEKENLHAVQTMLPEAMYDLYDADNLLKDKSYKEKTFNALRKAIEWADAIICGPGLSTSDEAKEILSFVLSNANLPLVLDADALNIIAEDEEIKNLAINYKYQKIMTPHLGEFSRLCGLRISECKKDILTLPGRLAKLFHASIICKDARTIITDGLNYYINVFGNDGMATAGSGDVLSGVVGAFVTAGFEDLTYALSCAVFIHSYAGDAAAKKLGKRSMTARDITKALPDAFELRSE
ncbi:bifunctional ADP-dependent NAD(P)H-hydrate dehydratase/NAD(P)H-hydrate epimerase [Butyrivibrio sp. NC2002]|uniref:bifunctional ADP-dependent NAD(P)H-hydrate dehydratase/NAD(P)H-hydrate epimerase n=1 Tax=Butyrivibrio sp. NC2002 TaxID=1410610 RepID=UPI000569EA71|nr:bifunctional ADP-dependent NAD(P)H-hydrate dehydratase/NAD(P)H-hydrate epimerase [Butyrivibrio sp. NC2002]